MIASKYYYTLTDGQLNYPVDLIDRTNELVEIKFETPLNESELTELLLTKELTLKWEDWILTFNTHEIILSDDSVIFIL